MSFDSAVPRKWENWNKQIQEENGKRINRLIPTSVLAQSLPVIFPLPQITTFSGIFSPIKEGEEEEPEMASLAGRKGKGKKK